MTLNDFLAEWNNPSSLLRVHTSGSTGVPKELWVEKQRMLNSARITCDFLGLSAGQTALLCMPLDFIAGKMMVVRSLERGLRLLTVEPTSHPLAQLTEAPDFVAMVPLQVARTLQVPTEATLLRQIRQLIIGGGAIDDSLQQALLDFPHAVWSTYGMTETLSHIALRRLNGPEASLWYTPFAGVTIRLTDEGTLAIHAPAVCVEELFTNDIAELNERGQFRILGRRDNTICTGGIKVQIEEAERLLRLALPSSMHDSFFISWRNDALLGQAVVLVAKESLTAHQRQLLQTSFSALPRYWQPRHLLFVVALPLTGTQKPDRAALHRLAEDGVIRK